MITKLAEELMKDVIMMLGTFPKTFSQATTSQGYFTKWILPNYAISRATTYISIRGTSKVYSYITLFFI